LHCIQFPDVKEDHEALEIENNNIADDILEKKTKNLNKAQNIVYFGYLK
jgi:hypothetical protein